MSKCKIDLIDKSDEFTYKMNDLKSVYSSYVPILRKNLNPEDKATFYKEYNSKGESTNGTSTES